MNAFNSEKPRRFPAVTLLLLIVIVGLAAGAWYLAPRFERDAPKITLTPDSDVVGLAPVEIAVSDQGAGLKSLTATLSVAGTEHSLAAEQYAEPLKEKKLTLATAKIAGIKEGPAVLRVTARDRSLWGFFKGNETVVQKNVTIDVTPPTLELIADDRYINFGGSGAIVYKSSPDTVTSGVKIGEYFFQGTKGQVKDQPEHIFALFAHPYNVPPGTKAVLVATDKAGNTREMPLVYELKNVNYKKSTIALTDGFLQTKVVPLVKDADARQGAVKDVFVAVNKRLRKENEDKITAVTRNSTVPMLWNGAFTQLSNSKVEANFADQRTYTYNNQPVDTAYHLGYDLSVTKRYPIEAANSGRVAFTGDLGIYGNTVILDHGLGLYTLYSHMSAIDVKDGETVKQKQVLGRTGETGLAGGDHLHFGVYLQGVAVLPVEWWDPKWIRDNIEPKLEGRSGEEIAQAQAPAPRKATRKRRR
jgi:murein DD-endopeptidase MepM/ murein hydrolase activator NlpD